MYTATFSALFAEIVACFLRKGNDNLRIRCGYSNSNLRMSLNTASTADQRLATRSAFKRTPAFPSAAFRYRDSCRRAWSESRLSEGSQSSEFGRANAPACIELHVGFV